MSNCGILPTTLSPALSSDTVYDIIVCEILDFGCTHLAKHKTENVNIITLSISYNYLKLIYVPLSG